MDNFKNEESGTKRTSSLKSSENRTSDLESPFKKFRGVPSRDESSSKSSSDKTRVEHARMAEKNSRGKEENSDTKRVRFAQGIKGSPITAIEAIPLIGRERAKRGEKSAKDVIVSLKKTSEKENAENLSPLGIPNAHKPDLNARPRESGMKPDRRFNTNRDRKADADVELEVLESRIDDDQVSMRRKRLPSLFVSAAENKRESARQNTEGNKLEAEFVKMHEQRELRNNNSDNTRRRY